MLELNQNHYEQIKDFCLKTPKIESCGLILQKDSEIIVYLCENISEFPYEHFLISKEQEKTAKEWGEIKGVFHSHLSDSTFSLLDKVIAEKLNIPSLIYKIPSGSFETYYPCGFKAPFVGRDFCAGILDCSELVKDYYLRELNIVLNNLNHPVKFINNYEKHSEIIIQYNREDNDFLKEYFEENGFLEVKEVKKHDIILIKTSNIKCAVHCLIYLGNDKILHHPSNRASLSESYTNFYKTRKKYIMRHKNLM